MKNAAQLRQQIECSLSERIPYALAPRQRRASERIASGVAALDDLLLGGIPVGSLSELVGPESSGRTTAVLPFVARLTQSEQVAAWIDVSDTLDPETAAANGVDLERLLWVRCSPSSQTSGSTTSAPPEPAANGTRLPGAMAESTLPMRGGGNHPRSEGQGMSQAISAMLQPRGGLPNSLYDPHARQRKRAIGTPGAANRPLVFRSEDREEQVASDRVPSHRAEQALAARCAEPIPERRRGVVHKDWAPARQQRSDAPRPQANKSWHALDQAIKVADLLLQGGGFRLIVLDLGSLPAEMVWRVPLATWFRFRAACERTQGSLLLLTQHPCARSSAELVMRMAAGRMQVQGRVMAGVAFRAETERQRFADNLNVVPIRKGPQPEHGPGARWQGGVAWATGR